MEEELYKFEQIITNKSLLYLLWSSGTLYGGVGKRKNGVAFLKSFKCSKCTIDIFRREI